MKRRLFSGFTLVETVVTVALTGFIMLTLAFIIQYFYKTAAYALEQTQAINSARRSVENTVTDLREASYGEDGSYPIVAAATSSVTFFANVLGDGAVEKVHYYLSGPSLFRGTTEPAGNPPSYAGQPETVTLVIDNIRNGTSTPLLRYFDASGNELPAPVNVAKVASVRIQVLTDVNPRRAPDVYTLDGAATLRNLDTIQP